MFSLQFGRKRIHKYEEEAEAERNRYDSDGSDEGFSDLEIDANITPDEDSEGTVRYMF